MALPKIVGRVSRGVAQAFSIPSPANSPVSVCPDMWGPTYIQVLQGNDMQVAWKLFADHNTAADYRLNIELRKSEQFPQFLILSVRKMESVSSITDKVRRTWAIMKAIEGVE